MKYIDVEKLKAEIERLEVLYDKALKNPSFPNDEAYLIAKGKHRQREDILRLIDSLQQEQPAADLEKAFAHEYAIYHLPMHIIASVVNGTELIDFIYETARHFYELGLNARNEE